MQGKKANLINAVEQKKKGKNILKAIKKRGS
jgi:hypothetical protein